MRRETVEIYSDASNMAVLRHPGRKFPGVLVQGDTLHSLAQSLERVLGAGPNFTSEATAELSDVAEHLQEFLMHYKRVLAEHNIELPFNDTPSF